MCIGRPGYGDTQTSTTGETELEGKRGLRVVGCTTGRSGSIEFE